MSVDIDYCANKEGGAEVDDISETICAVCELGGQQFYLLSINNIFPF